jgi:hypothetical protein
MRSKRQWKFPLAPTLNALGGDVREYRSGKSKLRCPFHDDSRPSAEVNWSTQHFRCYACGVYGDAVDLWESQEGLNREAARDRAEEISSGRDLAVSGARELVSLFD